MRLSTLEGVFAAQYATLAGGPLLAAFLLVLGATELQIGLAAALPLLGGLMQPVGAEVIRRSGGWRRPVCLASALADVLLWGVSLGAVGLLEPRAALWAILGVLVAQQAAAAFTAVAWTSWISDLVPSRLRGRYFGRRNFVCNALGAVTAALAGWVVNRAGPDTVFVFCALIMAGLGFRLMSIFFLSRQPEPAPARSPQGGFFEQLARPLAHEGFRRYLTYGAAWSLSVQLAAPFFTVYMIREAGVEAGTVLLFAALGTLANLLGQRVWGPLCDRYGDHQVLRISGLVVALQPLGWLFTTASGPGFYLMGLLSLTGGFAWGGNLLAGANLMMRLAPSLGKTSFFAAQAALSGLFGALGPLLGGLIAAALPAALPGAAPFFASGLLAGLKTLFFLSGALRLAAWGLLLRRVPVPEPRPRLRAVYLLRGAVRTFNPAQGFNPLLHVFAAAHVLRPRAKRKQS